jgi:hypothetical protein
MVASIFSSTLLLYSAALCSPNALYACEKQQTTLLAELIDHKKTLLACESKIIRPLSRDA